MFGHFVNFVSVWLSWGGVGTANSRLSEPRSDPDCTSPPAPLAPLATAPPQSCPRERAHSQKGRPGPHTSGQAAWPGLDRADSAPSKLELHAVAALCRSAGESAVNRGENRGERWGRAVAAGEGLQHALNGFPEVYGSREGAGRRHR